VAVTQKRHFEDEKKQTNESYIADRSSAKEIKDKAQPGQIQKKHLRKPVRRTSKAAGGERMSIST